LSDCEELVGVFRTVPLPYPKRSKHFDYGLQHKFAIKRIFTLFFTNMFVLIVGLRRISGGLLAGDDVVT
jgi:hypothetical protein